MGPIALCFPGIAPYRAIPPIQTPIALPFACLQYEVRGVSHVKLPSEGYRAIGGYSSYSIAVSRYTAPLSSRMSRTVNVNSFKVPEGHHPRGTTLREALRGNLPLRGLCRGLSEGSAGSLRGFCGVSAGFCGGPRNFPRFSGVVTLCL